MRKPTVKCALLAAMVAQHRWGSPITEENLLSTAAIEGGEYTAASEAFDDLRAASYISSLGNRGIKLDNSHFGDLADVLFHECGWQPYEIESRLKHYEGWNRYDWA